MKNFGYCIWLLPNNTNWNNYTNGFIFHMTIKHSLTLSDAMNIYSKLKISSQIMELSEKYTLDKEHNFNALYYILKTENIQECFPKNFHVSLFYKYNESITNEEIQNIKKLSNTVTFDKIALVDCNNKHFKDWNIICCKKLL
tara:strand:- start:336 stop:761 length:426 start_codon:yes stop_codon:yes gene_type:complete